MNHEYYTELYKNIKRWREIFVTGWTEKFSLFGHHSKKRPGTNRKYEMPL